MVPADSNQPYDDVNVLSNFDIEYHSDIKTGAGGSSASSVQAASTGGKKKQGLSVGSSLRSIAEGSSNTAKDAVNNQDAAGYQAAYVAKNTLAQSAAGVRNYTLITDFFLFIIYFH